MVLRPPPGAGRAGWRRRAAVSGTPRWPAARPGRRRRRRRRSAPAARGRARPVAHGGERRSDRCLRRTAARRGRRRSWATSWPVSSLAILLLAALFEALDDLGDLDLGLADLAPAQVEQLGGAPQLLRQLVDVDLLAFDPLQDALELIHRLAEAQRLVLPCPRRRRCRLLALSCRRHCRRLVGQLSCLPR